MQTRKKLIKLITGLLLILATLLAGCGPAQVVEQPPTPATVPPEVAAAPPSVPPTPALSELDLSLEAAATANSAGDTLAAPKLTAQIGKITFASESTEQHEPINPSLLFAGDITKIHAIFDYSGMLPSDTWERVWRLNDKEVVHKADLWTGPESGVFDYFIDNSGRPLPSGDWVLEIYVQDKLVSLGAFVIENEEAQANDSQ